MPLTPKIHADMRSMHAAAKRGTDFFDAPVQVMPHSESPAKDRWHDDLKQGGPTIGGVLERQINFHMGEVERLQTLRTRLKADPLSVSIEDLGL